MFRIRNILNSLISNSEGSRGKKTERNGRYSRAVYDYMVTHSAGNSNDYNGFNKIYRLINGNVHSPLPRICPFDFVDLKTGLAYLLICMRFLQIIRQYRVNYFRKMNKQYPRIYVLEENCVSNNI